MDSYLSGRGYDPDLNESVPSSEFRSFGSLIDLSKKVSTEVENIESENKEINSEVIYEEQDSPVVEVISVDGSPKEIVITMLDGKILRISCEY